MNPLSDPAVREAGARALYIHRINPSWMLVDPLDPDEVDAEAKRWIKTAEHIREGCRQAWDRIAAEVGPVVERVAAEQVAPMVEKIRETEARMRAVRDAYCDAGCPTTAHDHWAVDLTHDPEELAAKAFGDAVEGGGE